MVRHLAEAETNPAPVIYLYPGDICASREQVVLRTVLGSCVSVCLWDPVRRVGGMNHFLLARSRGPEPDMGRYGDLATRELVRRVIGLGAKRQNLKAKIFGGGGVLGRAGPLGGLGRDNVESATRVLSDERITVTATDVGGDTGRRLILRLTDGTTSCTALSGPRR